MAQAAIGPRLDVGGEQPSRARRARVQEHRLPVLRTGDLNLERAPRRSRDLYALRHSRAIIGRSGLR